MKSIGLYGYMNYMVLYVSYNCIKHIGLYVLYENIRRISLYTKDYNLTIYCTRKQVH